MSHVKVMMVKHDKREIEQLKHVFEDMPDYEYIGCCERGDEAVKKIAEDKPDIVIADEVIPVRISRIWSRAYLEIRT